MHGVLKIVRCISILQKLDCGRLTDIDLFFFDQLCDGLCGQKLCWMHTDGMHACDQGFSEPI